jgi:hypothetical protein
MNASYPVRFAVDYPRRDRYARIHVTDACPPFRLSD